MMSSPVSQAVAASELLARRRARESLLDFTTYTKPDYQVSWHHRALCAALDQFVSGETTRLMVSMPPRHGKSELVSRRLPAYLLGRDPDTSVIACSYSADLASAMNRDVQRIIDSPAYHRLFPDTTLYGSNVRTTAQGAYLRNSDIFEIVGHTGVYRSAGVGGGITGMGADYGIIDDPVKNQEEAASPTYRAKVWEWYTTTLYTRLEKADSRILLTMTRWHEDDLAGRLLEAAAREDGEQWEVICFPAIAEEARDPRDPRQEGEPLWPAKFPTERLATMKTTLGTYPWAALYQQAPAPAGGGLFKQEWFRYCSPTDSGYILHSPEGAKAIAAKELTLFQTCDPAGSLKASADFFTLGTWGLTTVRDLLLLDVIKTRLEGPDQPGLIRTAYERWGPVKQGIEPKGIGLTLFQQLKRDGLPVVELHADTDKFTRALPMAARYEAGTVYHLAGAPWLVDFERELVNFPGGAHDDQVDMASYAYHMQETIQMTPRRFEAVTGTRKW